jgi:pimeloyl-ACP methyl ester carboxylesterase
MPEAVLSPGLTIHYLDINPARERVILLLHGLGADGSSWQLQFPALTALGYRILAPDARGFGKSTYPPDSPSSIQETARDFARLLEHLGITRVDVVGISMGGTHALALALDCPELIGHLVLVNTFAQLRPRSYKGWLYYALRFVLVHTMGLEVQARTVAARLFPKPDQAELRSMLIQQVIQADPKAYRTAMRALAKFDVKRRLSEIYLPTLVITGERDTTVPQDVQQQLVKAISKARQVLVPGAGHALSVDSPEQFNQILTDFLSNQGTINGDFRGFPGFPSVILGDPQKK